MKRRWMTPLFFVLLAVIVIGCTRETAKTTKPPWDYDNPVQTTSGAFTYHAYVSGDEDECWIYQIDVNTEEGDAATLSIPSEIDGIAVTHIGFVEVSNDTGSIQNIFGNVVDSDNGKDGYAKTLKGIRSIFIPDSVTDIERACFSGLRYLRSVEIPDNVRRLRSESFYGCRRLRTVKLPAKLAEFRADAFNGCTALKTLSISSDNEAFEIADNCMLLTKQEQELVFVTAGKRKLEIPEGVTGIATGAFTISRARSVQIPSTVQSIGSRALENEHIRDIRIADDNDSFAISGQCIYAKNDNRLVVAIPNTNGYLRISNRITKLDSTFSIAGGTVKVVIFSRNLEEVSGSGLNFDRDGALKRVYFTGTNPPEVSNEPDDGSALPIAAVYVPKNTEDKYREWYEDHDSYDLVANWDTYNQNQLKRAEDRANTL